MFADLDRSDGTRDAPSLTRLVTQFLDKLSSVMTHAPPSLVCALWQVAAGRWHSWLAAALMIIHIVRNLLRALGCKLIEPINELGIAATLLNETA